MEVGISQIEAVVAENRSLDAIESLATAYLWIGRYDRAAIRFDEVIASRPKHSDKEYRLSGCAKWCLGWRAEAVETWKNGLGCPYTQAGDLTGIPRLLVFAATRSQDDFALSLANDLLRTALCSPWSKGWPTLLGKFLLGEEPTVEIKRCIDRPLNDVQRTFLASDELVNDYRWTYEFYRGVVTFQHGNISEFVELMARTAQVSDRTNVAEFYLARYESARHSIRPHR